MESRDSQKLLSFVSDTTNNKIVIYQNNDGILFFEGYSGKNVNNKIIFQLDNNHPFFNSILNLYQAVLDKYYIDTREHVRRYLFGQYSLLIPPVYNYENNNRITWYSMNNFNQFQDISPNHEHFLVKEQSFGIEKMDDGFQIRYTNDCPDVEFCILPNNLAGNYRPFLQRGSQDFFTDIENFYKNNKGETIKLQHLL